MLQGPSDPEPATNTTYKLRSLFSFLPDVIRWGTWSSYTSYSAREHTDGEHLTVRMRPLAQAASEQCANIRRAFQCAPANSQYMEGSCVQEYRIQLPEGRPCFWLLHTSHSWTKWRLQPRPRVRVWSTKEQFLTGLPRMLASMLLHRFPYHLAPCQMTRLHSPPLRAV